MSFGENILKKYGWTKGKGLGREENGISTFIKPKLKCSLSGVGYSTSDEHTFRWWDHVYNKAANNISIKKNETGKVEIVRAGEIKISTKKWSLKKNKELSSYGNFVKSCVLDGNKITETNSLSSDEEEENLESLKNYTDEELFKMCGGLTGHKGARHGLTMSAKLARLEEQEKKFLERFSSNEHENKKKRKNSSSNEPKILCNANGDSKDKTDNNVEKKLPKKEKKKKKNESHDEKVICSDYDPVNCEEEGLTMSAKLALLEEQEKKILENFSKSNEHENKKKRKNSSSNEPEILCNVNSDSKDKTDNNVEERLPKRKKKKKKSHDEKVIYFDYDTVNGEQEGVSSTVDCENESSKRKHKKKKKR